MTSRCIKAPKVGASVDVTINSSYPYIKITDYKRNKKTYITTALYPQHYSGDELKCEKTTESENIK